MSARHVLRWVGAEAFVASPVQVAPAILRFDGDDFMDRMLGLLAAKPQDLPSLVAQPENWRGLADPTPALPDNGQPAKSRFARLLSRKQALKDFNRTENASASLVVQKSAVPLKLFQPVHQRYYLAAAHLVCEQPGLPTRQTSAGDRSGFVIRRLFKLNNADVEHAFVKGADGQARWLPLTQPEADIPVDEEWLPVFPMSYAPPAGPQRPLLAGLIPVSKRDQYQFAGQTTAAGQASGEQSAWTRADQLKALARADIIAPWQALLERAYAGGASATKEDGTLFIDSIDIHSIEHANYAKMIDAITTTNNQLTESSWRLLQQIREFLAAYLKGVVTAIDGGGSLSGAAGDLLQALRNAHVALPANVISADVTGLQLASSLADAIKRMGENSASANLDRMDSRFPDLATPAIPPQTTPTWPGFVFPMAVALALDANDFDVDNPANRKLFIVGPFHGFALGAVSLTGLDKPSGSRDFIRNAARDADNLTLDNPPLAGQTYAQAPVSLFKLIALAIDEAVSANTTGSDQPQAPFAARLAAELGQSLAADPGPARYVLRFVHRRCDCGPLHPAVISAPSMPFELAGFFDPEAPLRPIRIVLPFDTTPGGLRKYAKNSGFIVSDVLCGQMKRIRRLGFVDLVRSVLPWPLHKDLDLGAMGPCGKDTGVNFGMICSLSIPIITIVAFILLIVIATLLDLIFGWLPYLILCFPVPGLKGKPNG